MGKKFNRKVTEEPVVEKDVIDVVSDGEKEIFEIPTEELKASLKEAEPAEKRNYMARVTGVDLLNVRAIPNGAIIGQVSKGVELKILDVNPKQEAGEDWFNVCTPIGMEGWAMSKFLFLYEEGKYKEV